MIKLVVSIRRIQHDIWERYAKYRLVAELSATCVKPAFGGRLLTGDDLGALEVLVRMEIAWGQSKPEADEE